LGLPLAQAHDYYVSPNGSDSAVGTLDQPFQTIQKAASVMVAGDTAYIRAGVYRETVIPKNSGTEHSPITYMPYNGESVTVSGADVIPAGSWTLSSGNIYRAPMSWDLGAGAGTGMNQVFLDGQMMIEARWPNTTSDLSHPILASSGNGSYVDGGTGLSTGTITDPNLPPRPDGYWRGSTIQMSLGAKWQWQTGSVVDSTQGQLTFTFTKFYDALVPGPNNPYYLTGKLSELDTGGEWLLDSPSSTLYLWTPAGDKPSSHLVEAKRRQLAFDLSSRSFITVTGIAVFGATIYTDGSSQYLLLDNLDGKYLAHSILNTNTAGYTDGIRLIGTNNVLRNSSLAYSFGTGVLVSGTGHRIFNNVMHDLDYMGEFAGAIFSFKSGTVSSGKLLAYNTIYNTGNSGITHGGDGERVLHNELYNIGLLTSDLGCTYTHGTDGKGSEIAFNLCHDNKALPFSDGIYLDNNTSNYIVHHNVVWNAQFSSVLNSVSTNNRAYNNTYAGTVLGVSVYSPSGTSQLPGTELKNNIFTAPIMETPGAVLQNNIFSGTDPQFVDAANHNFQLKSTSPAIGAGAIIPPYTDGFLGSAPDIGAYDHNKPAWKAGVQAAARTVSLVDYGPSLAPGSAAVVFGTVPFDQGVSVLVTDGANADLPATVLSVVASPPQLTFAVPSSAASGVAMITITNGDGTVSLSSATIFPVAYPTQAFAMANRGGTSVASSGAGSPITVGYAGIQPNSGSSTPSGIAIFDFRQNNTLVSEVGVPATRALSSGRIYCEIAGAVDTGLAIANPNSSTATISFYFTDANGNPGGSGSMTIGPNQQTAQFLDQAPFKVYASTTFQGTFSFTSSVPVAVVALRGFTNERGDFLMSTLPVVDTTVAPNNGTAVVPHFADGGGWTTKVLLVNPTDNPMTGSLQFSNPTGAAANVMIGGQTNSSFAYSIPGRSSQKLATSGVASITASGSIQIVPASGGAGPTPLVVFSYKPAGITVSEAGVPITSGSAFRVYVESSGVTQGNIESGIAVANTSSAATSVTFDLTDLTGAAVSGISPVSITLPGFGQTAKFLNDIFPSLPIPFKGVLRITTTSSGLSVVGLRTRINERGDFLITTTPPTNENSPAGMAEMFFPQVADGGGYTTQFILFSGIAGQATSGNMQFVKQDGSGWVILN